MSLSSYVALGDSFTAGHDSAEGACWADLLAKALGEANPGMAYTNLALDGAGSDDVLERQLPEALALGPDLVTVICGANDVLLTSRPDVAGYERRFSEILERLRAGAPAAAIMTTTAPDGWQFLELRPRTRARLDGALAELNAATRAVAERHGVLCLEVAGHPGLMERENFSVDGLHPSALGHERAAEEIALSLHAHFGIEGARKGVGSR